MYSTMKYTVQTLSPVLVTGEQGDANILRTLDYIPGSAILGAFASGYIKKNGPVMEETGGEVEYDDIFYSWFLGSDLKFMHAYPTVHDGNTAIALEPTPLSIQIDKNGKNMRNMLLNSDVEGDPDLRTRPLGDYIGFKSKEDRSFFLASPEKTILFHHARSGRLEGSSQEGEIFNYEALCEGQCFSGFIAGNQEKTEAFRKYFGDEILMTVGRSRSAQYGRILLKLEEPQEPDYENILDRYFDHENYDDDDNASLIIFLRTPLIIKNGYGFSATSLSDLESIIEESLGESIDITGSFYSIRAVENHIAVWGMKRPLDLAFTGGSAFRLKFDRPMDEILRKKIISLLEQGLGERRNEGFGSVCISPTLALEYGRDLKLKSLEKDAPPKPEGEIPGILKATYIHIIRDILQKIAEQRGRGDAAGYIKTPSNSLLGRLELMINGIIPLGEVDFMKQFASSVGQLRDTAKNSLKECYRQRYNEGNLFKNITGTSDTVAKGIFYTAIESYQDLGELSKLCGYNFEEDTALGNNLHRAYWLSLLRRMRKINKEKDR